MKILICLTHMICLLLLEALLAVTIIWFLDYGYSLNGVLLVCAVLVLGVHYAALMLYQKRGTLSRGTIYTLLCFDSTVCLLAAFGWIGIQIYLRTMPMGQIIFAVAVNGIILLLRAAVTGYLRGLR